MKNDNPFECFWITKNKNLVKDLKRKNLPVLYLYSLKGFISLIRANFLLTTHGSFDVSFYFYLPGKFIHIQTWHGTPLKKIGVKYTPTKNNFYSNVLFKPYYFKDNQSWNLILSTSNELIEIYADAFENKKIKVLGYPRIDVFFDKQLIYHNYDDKLKLGNFEKIFLCCPTFRDIPNPHPLFSYEFLVELNTFFKKLNYVLLIKSHVYENLKINSKNLSNILDVSDKIDDIQELLIYADVLITDYSSVVFDFVLLDKPVIFYCYDFDEYLKKSRKMYFDYFTEFPGPFAKSESELFEYIKKINDIFETKEYHDKYIRFKNKFNTFSDGNSCGRLLDCLKKF